MSQDPSKPGSCKAIVNINKSFLAYILGQYPPRRASPWSIAQLALGLPTCLLASFGMTYLGVTSDNLVCGCLNFLHCTPLLFTKR